MMAISSAVNSRDPASRCFAPRSESPNQPEISSHVLRGKISRNANEMAFCSAPHWSFRVTQTAPPLFAFPPAMANSSLMSQTPCPSRIVDGSLTGSGSAGREKITASSRWALMLHHGMQGLHTRAHECYKALFPLRYLPADSRLLWRRYVHSARLPRHPHASHCDGTLRGMMPHYGCSHRGNNLGKHHGRGVGIPSCTGLGRLVDLGQHALDQLGGNASFRRPLGLPPRNCRLVDAKAAGEGGLAFAEAGAGGPETLSGDLHARTMRIAY